AFRLHQAIPKSLFQERTFLSLSNKPIQANIQSALNKGLISETETHWQTTELGNRFLNTLLELFS
ncbi:MAG: YggW family oxidoreductase, partial [Pseudomonadales bacterium]|nr:YggW family oxidoreductase [Pseudomonadales bacterium]